VNGRSSLVSAARALISAAIEAAAGTPSAGPLADALARLDGPLRVAIAGKVKAGKSTLLNAIVGEELAPTDAGECTRVVTWYRQGLTYRVMARHVSGGAPFDLAFSRDGGAVDVDLGGYSPQELAWLDVQWPSSALASLTLVDTPGLESISSGVSQRTADFLAPGEEGPRAADAVLYLMRHVHGEDVRFLEAFHDDDVAQATPVNAIGVLSRADEIGAGRLDSLDSAARIAARYRCDVKLRRLCQTVLPVAGLLAQAGATLREVEFAALSELASSPAADLEAVLVSVDRFRAEEAPVHLAAEERQVLLDRLGIFGIRLSLALIAGGAAANASQLARALVDHSGLTELRRTLATQFAQRAEVLKARSALLAVDAAIARGDLGGTGIDVELERITASAHELAEIRLLNAIRAGNVTLRDDEAAAAEELLGATGASAGARLGLGPDPDVADVRQAALAGARRWQSRAENPMSSRDAIDAARVLVRTCEGILAGTVV